MTDLDFCTERWKPIVQLFHYSLVGIGSNLVGYIIYLLITYFGGTPKTTMSILYGVGATISFWGNRKLTFAHKGNLLGTLVRYFFAHSLGYCLNLVILIVMVDNFGYAHQWVQAIAILIVAFFLFFTFKFFVFKEPVLSNGGRE